MNVNFLPILLMSLTGYGRTKFYLRKYAFLICFILHTQYVDGAFWYKVYFLLYTFTLPAHIPASAPIVPVCEELTNASDDNAAATLLSLPVWQISWWKRRYTHRQAYVHTRTRTHIHARTHARIHTHTHTHTRTRSHIHARTHTHTHTHTCTQTPIYVY